MEPGKADKPTIEKNPEKQQSEITSGVVVVGVNEVSEDSSVEKRNYGGKGNGRTEAELETARQVRQARNKNSAAAYRKKKQNDIEVTREEAKLCDVEIRELRERLRVVRGKNVELEEKVTREKRKRDDHPGAGDRVDQNNPPGEPST